MKTFWRHCSLWSTIQMVFLILALFSTFYCINTTSIFSGFSDITLWHFIEIVHFLLKTMTWIEMVNDVETIYRIGLHKSIKMRSSWCHQCYRYRISLNCYPEFTQKSLHAQSNIRTPVTQTNTNISNINLHIETITNNSHRNVRKSKFVPLKTCSTGGTSLLIIKWSSSRDFITKSQRSRKAADNEIWEPVSPGSFMAGGRGKTGEISGRNKRRWTPRNRSLFLSCFPDESRYYRFSCLCQLGNYLGTFWLSVSVWNEIYMISDLWIYYQYSGRSWLPMRLGLYPGDDCSLISFPRYSASGIASSSWSSSSSRIDSYGDFNSTNVGQYQWSSLVTFDITDLANFYKYI